MKYGEFSVMMAKIEGILKEYNLAINGVMAQLDNTEYNETAIDLSICPAPIDLECQPAEREGYWIESNIVLTTYPEQFTWNCSECGYQLTGVRDLIEKTKVCPHCNTRMTSIHLGCTTACMPPCNSENEDK